MRIKWEGNAFRQHCRIFDGLIELSIQQDGLASRWYIDCQGIGTRKILRIEGDLSFGTQKEAMQAAEKYVKNLINDVLEDKIETSVIVKVPYMGSAHGEILTHTFTPNDLALEIQKVAYECYYHIRNKGQGNV